MRLNRLRLVNWSALVLVIASLNYYARFTSSSSGSGGREDVYSWSSFTGGILVYAVWLGLVLAIAAGQPDLLALRRPRSIGRAAGLCVAAIAAIYMCSALVSLIPLPQSPSNEQGITPTHWEPRYAAAFAANCVLFAVVAPFVEELMYRGVGQSLLRALGRWPSILVVGVAFGITHGLLEALLILIPFGIVLAYVRDRTDSAVPGMLVHAAFNGTALALSVL